MSFSKKLTSSAVLLLSLTTYSCSTSKHLAKKKQDGIWQSTPIVVDGDSKDWPSPYPAYDTKALIGYAYSNDKDNLYLTIETGDQMTQLKILRAGMTVWIDTTGKKEEKIAIHFPLKDTDHSFNLQNKSRQNRNTESANPEDKSMTDRLKKMVDRDNQMLLEGFGACSGGIDTRQENSCGITVRIGLDEYNELIWEAKIPFKAIYKNPLTAANAGKPISVCFAVNALKRPSSSNGNSEGGNGNRMGGGGMHRGGGGMGDGMRGGGMHGGYGGNRSANEASRENLFKNTKTWKQFSLAYKPS